MFTSLIQQIGGVKNVQYAAIDAASSGDNTIVAAVAGKQIAILGCVIVGFAFSTMYSKWSRGHHSISEGAQFGIWLGVLMGLGSGLIDFATANLLDISGTLINAVIYIVHFAIMGVVASLVYSKFSDKK